MSGSFFLKFELTTWKRHPMQCKQHRRGKERSSTYQCEIVSSDSARNSSWYKLLRATVEVWVQGREQEERQGLQRPPNPPRKCNRRWQELQVRRIAWCLWEGLKEDTRNGGEHFPPPVVPTPPGDQRTPLSSWPYSRNGLLISITTAGPSPTGRFPLLKPSPGDSH